MPAEKIEEFVAVYVSHHDAAAALGHQRIGACVGRRNILLIARQNPLGIWAGQGGLELRTCKCLGGHGLLQKTVIDRRSSVVSQGAVAPKKADSAP